MTINISFIIIIIRTEGGSARADPAWPWTTTRGERVVQQTRSMDSRGKKRTKAANNAANSSSRIRQVMP